MNMTSTGYKLIAPVLLFSTIWMFGCQKSSITFGQQYIDNGYTNIIELDTITPSVSTIFKDSIPTSQTGTILLGNYPDPFFGNITASSYLTLVPNTNTLPDLLNNAGYDSISFLIKSTGNYFGDTTLSLTYNVSQLADQIALPEGQVGFYNTSSFHTTGLLGSRTVGVRPSFGDTVAVRLQDALGNVLFSMLKRKSDTLKDNNTFTPYFRGLQIATNNSNLILGFKDSAVIRLYYHETDLFRQNRTFDFTLNNKNFQFNNISYNRSGKPVAVLNTNFREAPSNQTGNMGFTQSITGLYLKVAFPNIRFLLQRPDYVKIVKAELVVKPVAQSFNYLYPLPPVLVASSTDGVNEPGGTLASTVNGVIATETGNLFIDYLYGLNTAYTYDVTSYLQQQASLTGFNENGLLLIPAGDRRYSTMDRVVVGDSKIADVNARMQLKIFYVSINR